MSRFDGQRLEDILAAIDAIRGHLDRGDLSDGLIFDAVRVRLIEIGEAVKALPTDLVATEPEIPWNEIARNARPARSSLLRHFARHRGCNRRR